MPHVNMDVTTLKRVTQLSYGRGLTIITVQQYVDLHGISQEVTTQPCERLNLVPIRESSQPNDRKATLITHIFSAHRASQISQDFHIFALDK